MGRPYYITTAIDYVNALPHLGTAYEKIGADCVARFHRQLGDEVRFLMGTDEHSLNVLNSAEARGMEPQAFCDEMAAGFEAAWAALHISHDDFIRTTDARHVATVQALVQKIHDAGDIYQGKYEGWYCVSCESFLQEADLVEGLCKTHEKTPDWIEEENYFFRLSAYQERLLAHLDAHPEFVEPAVRRNEVRAVLEGGLQDVSISRTGTSWGIPLPFDASVVTYVWFDALINYVSGAGFSTDAESFARFWPCDCHVIGKDITRFHCIIWPAMLLSAGLPLPKQVYAHGFVYFKGRKFSKSAGVVVDPLEAAERFGPDALRYFLLREISFGQDGDFTWTRFADRYNAELANDLGNLVNRVRTLASKFGDLPRPADPQADPLDAELASLACSVRDRWREQLSTFEIHMGIGTVWELVRLANKYVEESKPWALARDEADRERLGAVLYNLAEASRWLAVLLFSVMPERTQAIWDGLGLDGALADATLDVLAEWAGPASFDGISKGKPLFPRIDKAKQLNLISEDEAVGGTDETAAGADDSLITIDDFAKVELKVGVVREAARVEGADRLLRLQVEIGKETRQLVAGIAEHYPPEELVGQSVVVVANLQPATIRGVESRGMILAASSGKTLTLVQPTREIKSGARVR